MSTVSILTVDGPSGVGKGTVARIMSQKKGWHLLDSGAIYRAFALAVDARGIDVSNESACGTPPPLLFSLYIRLGCGFRVA